MEIVYLSRNQVGYDPSLKRLGWLVDPRKRTNIIEHHTVGGQAVSRTEAGALVYVRRLQTIRPDLGDDVPYNFSVSYINPLIGRDRLLVCEGRGWDRTGAHTKGYNTAFIAFAWQGNHDKTEVPKLEEAQESLGRWIREEASREIPGNEIDWSEAFGHTDKKPSTECPGKYIYSTLSTFERGLEEGEEVPQFTPDEEARLRQIIRDIPAPGETDPTRFALGEIIDELEEEGSSGNVLVTATLTMWPDKPWLAADEALNLALQEHESNPHGGGVTEEQVQSMISSAVADKVTTGELADHSANPDAHHE